MLEDAEDYGSFYASVARPDIVVFPKNTLEVATLVCDAILVGAKIVTRGYRHSMNGSTNVLPHSKSMVMNTTRMDSIEFGASAGILVVGAGIQTQVLQQVLQQHNLFVCLPETGKPSLGGYICAGGPIPGPVAIWDYVQSIVIVDGCGNIHDVDRQCDIFPWLFGSSGQFGILTQVVLRGSSTAILKPIDREAKAARVVWWSVIVGPDQLDLAVSALQVLQSHFQSRLTFFDDYVYNLRLDSSIYPPLVLPTVHPLTTNTYYLCGIWTRNLQEKQTEIHELEDEFAAMCRQHKWKRYWQTEMVRLSLKLLESQLSATAFQSYLVMKQRLDPNCIFEYIR